MKKLAAFIFPVLLFSVYSCNDNDKDAPPVIYPTEVSTKHTMLYYFGIDNNFRNEKSKIDALRKAWKPEYDANLLVYADGGTNTVLVHIYHDKYGNAVADTIQTRERENSADPEVFARVLNDVYKKFPAETNGLLVLSHASGWLKQDKLTSPRSRTVIDDAGEGDQLDLWDFAANIPIKLDYIIFDACFMSGVEVMSELYGKTSFAVASSAEILAEYMQYPDMLSYLFAGEKPNLRSVVDNTYEYAINNKYTVNDPKYKSLTMSIVNVDNFPEMEDFCFRALKGIDIENSVNINELQQYFPINPLYTDLGDIIENIRPDLYEEFKNTLENCVIYSVHTPTYYSAYPRPMGSSNAINSFSGLTMYIPQAQFPGLNEDYKILKWYKKVFE